MASARQLERALRMMNYLARHAGGGNLSHLAHELGYPVSSTHDLLQALVEIRAARLVESHTYVLGPQAVALGLAIADSVDLRRAARPVLEALSVDLAETVCLAIRSGDDVIYAERHPNTTQSTSVVISLGESRPLHSSSAGKLLAAHVPELERSAVERMRRGLQPPFTPHTLTGTDELLAEYAAIRRQRYSLSDGEYVEGIRGLAVPIVDADGAVVAAAQVVAPRERLPDDRLPTVVARMAAAAAAVSEQLGALEPMIPRTVGEQ